MDLKTNPHEVTKGGTGTQNSDPHRFSPGHDLAMLQKNYVHRETTEDHLMSFNQGYEMPPVNSHEQNCTNEAGATTNRIHPFAPFASTPPGSVTNNNNNTNNNANNGSPFCAQSGAVAAAAVAAAGLSQQAQINNSQGSGAPPAFMDTPPSSFCSSPYNYSLYSMHSQDSRVKLEKEKEAAAAAAAVAYSNKHSAEDKELAAAKWITS